MSIVDRLREMLHANPSSRLAIQSALTGSLLVKREFNYHSSEFLEFTSAIDPDIGVVVVPVRHIVAFLHNRKYDRILVQLAH